MPNKPYKFREYGQDTVSERSALLNEKSAFHSHAIFERKRVNYTSQKENPNDDIIQFYDGSQIESVPNNISFFSKPYTWSELRCWLPILASMTFSLTTGSMLCFGNLTLYLASYLRMYLGENISYSDIQWIYSAQSITQGLATVLGSKIHYTISPRVASILSGLFLSFSLILSHYATSYRIIFLTYGLLFGLGNGLVYVLPFDIATKWQPERKGVATSLIFIARSLSVFALSPWQTWYVNPHNKSPSYISPSTKEVFYIDEYILRRVPQVFLWMGILFIALQILSAPLMSFPSMTDEHILRKKARAHQKIKYNNTPQLSIIQICKHKQFWKLWLISFFNWQSICFINGYWKLLGQVEFGISDTTLAILASFGAFSNLFGRLFWGYVVDYCGFRATMAAFCFSMTCFLLFIPVSRFLEIKYKVLAYSINLQIFHLIDGSAFTILTPEAYHIFGENNFATVFGLLFTARAISTIVSAQVIINFYNAVSSSSLCILMASSSLIAGVITLEEILNPFSLLKRSKNKHQSRDQSRAK